MLFLIAGVSKPGETAATDEELDLVEVEEMLEEERKAGNLVGKGEEEVADGDDGSEEEQAVADGMLHFGEADGGNDEVDFRAVCVVLCEVCVCVACGDGVWTAL